MLVCVSQPVFTFLLMWPPPTGGLLHRSRPLFTQGSFFVYFCNTGAKNEFIMRAFFTLWENPLGFELQEQELRVMSYMLLVQRQNQEKETELSIPTYVVIVMHTNDASFRFKVPTNRVKENRKMAVRAPRMTSSYSEVLATTHCESSKCSSKGRKQTEHTQSLGLLGCLKQESLLWVSIQLPSNIALHLHVHVTEN